MTWIIEPNPWAHCGLLIRDACGRIVADASPDFGRLIAAAPAMLAALQAVRPEIANEAENLLDCSAVHRDDGKPDRTTLDPISAAGLAELEALLAQIDAAIALAQAAP